jgi:HPt (histidine-containing phosphotransfer) domain-containing protein
MTDSDDRIKIEVDQELAEIIPGFLNNRRVDITTIYDCLEKNDLETVRRLGHSMKGSGSGYGFDKITEIGKAIEDSAKTSDIEKIKGLTLELSNYLDVVDVVYI